MTDYKQALDKAVEYIMQECEYCPICVNFEPCNKQMEEYGKQGKTCTPNLKLCKDGITQHFLRETDKETAQIEKSYMGDICGTCPHNDGLVYTSCPVQYKCTITNEYHYATDKCTVECQKEAESDKWII